jgi:hypothetical protein
MSHRFVRRFAPLLLICWPFVSTAQESGLAISGGAPRKTGDERYEIWANSPQTRLIVQHNGRPGVMGLTVTWQNLIAGTILSTPEGVVPGSSRDGSDIVSQLSVGPGERQSWGLASNVTGHYRFGVIGNTRNQERAQATYGALSRDMGQRYVQFALHLGNAVDRGSPRQMDLFREQLRSFGFPSYVLPGVHDLTQQGQRAWQQRFGGLPLKFRIDRDVFVLLDNSTGYLDAPQRRWLEQTLKAARQGGVRHLFVFMNRPLVDPRPGINEGMRDRQEVRRLLRLFNDVGVRAVFAGHLPMYTRDVRQGVTCITTGGGGDALTLKPSKGGFHHYVLVEVAGPLVSMNPIPLASGT